jgi:hypothetical protein
MTMGMEFTRVRCRCVACGEVSWQPMLRDQRDGRSIVQWFCGCSPRPQGTALDDIDGENGRCPYYPGCQPEACTKCWEHDRNADEQHGTQTDG